MTLPASFFPFLRRFAIASVVVAALTGATIVASNSYERRKFAESRTIVVPNVVPVQPGTPANYLLIGSDTRAGQQGFSQTEAPGARSDVVMVLHVDPRSRTGMLVSFPRDLVVKYPNGQQGLLSGAFDALGDANGPQTVIQTLESNFPPLKINHYLEVNFDGFRDIVNAIGKVKIWFPTPVHDPYSGLNIDNAGCVSLNGDAALAYARSRHYFIPKNVESPAPWQWNLTPGISDNNRGGYGWVEDPLEDLDRIPRQQYFLRTLARTAIDKTAGNPTKLFALLDAVKNNFAHDNTLKFSELQALVRTFNRLDPTQVDMETLPVVGATSGPWRGHVFATDAAIGLIERLMFWKKAPTGPPPALLPPNRVNVKIVNGSGIPALAETAFQEFSAAGFHVTNAGEADRATYDRTQIRYAPDKGAEGFTVATAVYTLNVLPAIDAQNTLGADVLVVVGRDYNALPHRFPGAATIPTSTTAAPSSTTTTVPESTTVTTATPQEQVNSKYVPTDPKNRGPLVGCP